MGNVPVHRDPIPIRSAGVHPLPSPIPGARAELGHRAAAQEDVEAELGEREDEAVTRAVITSGSSFEVFAGVVALALAILGLIGYAPLYLAAIATTAVGFSLLAQGSTIAARWQQATHIVGSERTDAMGIGTEIFGGLAAIVLGVLALMQVMPTVLLPIAAVALGVALLLGGPTQPDFAEVGAPDAGHHWQVTRGAARTSSGVMVMGGLAALVLGVLAIAGLAPALVLSLVAVVCVAAALMLSGGALLARFTSRYG